MAERLEKKIREAVATHKNGSEKIRKSLALQIENITLKKKSLLEKYVEGNIDSDAYKSYQADLETREAQCRAELETVDGAIMKALDHISRALKMAQNCYETYKDAKYEQKMLLAQTIFERVVIKDKIITSALLRHPFAYICKDKVSQREEFQYGYTGGDGG